MKSILNFMGINSVSGKYHCCYCKCPKDKSHDLSQKYEERNIKDWDSIGKQSFGIIRKMIIELRPDYYIVDTFHLRLRVLEKFFSSILTTILNFRKDDDFKTIEELNLYFLSQNIVAKIVKIPINDNYIKYKINCPNLSTKVKAVDNVIDYMKNKIFNFNHLDLIVTFWEVNRN
jgi:hypothetical protein